MMEIRQLWKVVLLFFLSHVAIASAADQIPAPSPCFKEYASTILSSFMALTEQHIRTVEHELAVLSMTEEVKSADWEKMRGILDTYQDSGFPGIVWFVLPDGNYYSLETGLVGKKLSERKYFPGLMSGKSVAGDLVFSRSTGKKSVIVAVPVKRNGVVVGGLGASVFLDDLSQRINDALSLPENLLFYALAPDGTATLNRNTRLNFMDPKAQGSKSLTLAAEKMLSTTEGAVTYEFEKRPRYVIYRTSALMGWKFAVGIKLGPGTSVGGQ
jgi:hypothetical protein